jgi:hypothetical protein
MERRQQAHRMQQQFLSFPTRRRSISSQARWQDYQRWDFGYFLLQVYVIGVMIVQRVLCEMKVACLLLCFGDVWPLKSLSW